MEIKLKRIARRNTYTIGKLYINGQYECDTIEDKDRGLSKEMPLNEIKNIKVYAKTAIPTGRYQVVWTYSAKFNKSLPLLLNVPGFEGIRIHSGNTEEDSAGCIILGQNKVVGKVINSTITCNKVFPKIKEASTKEKIYITIE